MKIQYAINSCDSNPLYFDFWKYTKQAWLKIGITPVLVYIAEDYNSKLIDEKDAIVIRLKPIPEIPIYFQTQWVRFWITNNFYKGVCITSDIDMIPLSRWHFVEQIQAYSSEDYLHLNSCIGEYGRLPVCYHVAKGDTFKEVLELDDTWEESVKRVYNAKFDNALHGTLHKWGNDEEYSTQKILAYIQVNQNRVKLLDRFGGSKNHRLDRDDWRYTEAQLNQVHFYDAHCARPLQQYESDIQLIINKIQ